MFDAHGDAVIAQIGGYQSRIHMVAIGSETFQIRRIGFARRAAGLDDCRHRQQGMGQRIHPDAAARAAVIMIGGRIAVNIMGRFKGVEIG